MNTMMVIMVSGVAITITSHLVPCRGFPPVVLAIAMVTLIVSVVIMMSSGVLHTMTSII